MFGDSLFFWGISLIIMVYFFIVMIGVEFMYLMLGELFIVSWGKKISLMDIKRRYFVENRIIICDLY